MADGLDWMDVRAMIEKAVNEERWSRNRHVESVEKDLRAEFRREVMELREEVGELVAELHTALEEERNVRSVGQRTLANIIDGRTEHVV